MGIFSDTDFGARQKNMLFLKPIGYMLWSVVRGVWCAGGATGASSDTLDEKYQFGSTRTAGKASASRGGLCKIRHADTRLLLIQRRVIHKAAVSVSNADTGTKDVTAETLVEAGECHEL